MMGSEMAVNDRIGGFRVAPSAPKSRPHDILFITALIVWNRAGASTTWTLTLVLGAFVNNAFSFALGTGFHS
jgi:hypothetical protein